MVKKLWNRLWAKIVVAWETREPYQGRRDLDEQ